MKRFISLCGLAVVWIVLGVAGVHAQTSDTVTSEVAGEAARERNRNARCFTEDQCRYYYEQNNWTYNESASFEANAEACTGVGNPGFCYPPTLSYDLIINLGSIEKVEGIAGYIRVIYSLAITFGSLLTVIIVMAAGLKWMAARGNPNMVSGAKEMIGKALVSMLILLSVVTLANIVDPQLSVIPQLKTPLIKKGIFVDPNTSCEYLKESLGFEINREGKCGDPAGKITALPPDNERGEAIIGAEVGKECRFTSCEKRYEGCISDAGRDICARCGDVGKGEMRASRATCEALRFTLYDDTADIKSFCTFVEDYGGLLEEFGESVDGVDQGSCVEYSYGGGDEPIIDCNRMRMAAGGRPGESSLLFDEIDALELETSSLDDPFGQSSTSPDAELYDILNGDALVEGGCRLYEDVEIRAGGLKKKLTTLTIGSLQSDYGFILREVCEKDICRVGGARGCEVRRRTAVPGNNLLLGYISYLADAGVTQCVDK